MTSKTRNLRQTWQTKVTLRTITFSWTAAKKGKEANWSLLESWKVHFREFLQQLQFFWTSQHIFLLNCPHRDTIDGLWYIYHFCFSKKLKLFAFVYSIFHSRCIMFRYFITIIDSISLLYFTYFTPNYIKVLQSNF